jgi:anthranilate synthase/aminodeoxychorismate synthase-like glutamine amidotransferase
VLLIVDNRDSFTYNIVQYFQILGEEVCVVRNDIGKNNPDFILLSPGPGSPSEAKLSLEVLKNATVPVLGVCLGCQCIAEAFGGRVVHADNVMHGKTSEIMHSNHGVFRNMPQGFLATRYHSLIVERHSLPDCLEITAETEKGEIMGLRHRELPIEGVQFHPESIITENGINIFSNFLRINDV